MAPHTPPTPAFTPPIHSSQQDSAPTIPPTKPLLKPIALSSKNAPHHSRFIETLRQEHEAAQSSIRHIQLSLDASILRQSREKALQTQLQEAHAAEQARARWARTLLDMEEKTRADIWDAELRKAKAESDLEKAAESVAFFDELSALLREAK